MILLVLKGLLWRGEGMACWSWQVKNLNYHNNIKLRSGILTSA